MELFEEQSVTYKEGILPSSVTNRVTVEAATTFGWDKYATKHVGIDTFGASGPAAQVYEKFGINVNICETQANVREGINITNYEKLDKAAFDDLLEFHYRFESIHPFQDGNGRVGRLILFKECLRNGLVPFIIEDDMKIYYYRGLQEWRNEKGYLRDTCLAAQDRFKAYLDYYGVKY